MMKRGMDWYKRDPISFLGGIQGMTSKQVAIYTIIIELVYQHGGCIHNDPKWIAGWVADMGSASVRNTIEELLSMGKLNLTADGQITQKRAENEVKTQEKRKENREKSGRKGGEKTAELWAKAKKNNDLAEAHAETRGGPEKRREEKNPPTPQKGGEGEEVFEEFWRAYPKRETASANPRKPAREKFLRAVRNGADPAAIIRGAQAYAAEQQRLGKAGTNYVAQAMTWLNQQRWEDYQRAPLAAQAAAAGWTADRWREVLRQQAGRGRLQDWKGRAPPEIYAEIEAEQRAA